MRRHEASTESNGPNLTTSGYDWRRFGRHRLRVPAAVLIESPLDAPGSGWLATLWPSELAAGGWARLLWQPESVSGPGWIVPARLVGGDVIEFGADRQNHPVRWYGIVDSYDAVEWLTLQGPYETPRAAREEAEQLLADLRYKPPLRARSARRPCTRRRDRRS